MSSENKLTERMCIACRQMKDKKELLRIVKCKDGTVKTDKSGKAQGRGAYICKNKNCMEKCIKSKLLNKAFKCQLEDEIYDIIKKEIEING